MGTTEIITMVTYVFVGILTIAAAAIAIVLIKQRYQKAPSTLNRKEELPKDAKKKSYDGIERGSVQDFMEFEKIEDDMIIRQDGGIYSMVIECKGINYDLMSQNERLSVEDAFVQTLNILRYPIQLYVQTRAADYNTNLKEYETRLEVTKEELSKLRNEYDMALNSEDTSEEKMQMLRFELRKKDSLYAYGQDIIEYIKKMNLNKSILQKKFYIIVTYYSTELGLTNKFGKEEISDFAYQELYNRCQSIITSLGGCQVVSKILDSIELAELLYVAYNRDDSEIYSLKRALESGYYSLYTTSEDILNKKRKYINEQIEKESLKKAQDAMEEAQNILNISKNDEEFRKIYKQAIEDGATDILLNSRGKFPDGLIKIAIDQVNEAILAKTKKNVGTSNARPQEELESKGPVAKTRGRRAKVS